MAFPSIGDIFLGCMNIRRKSCCNSYVPMTPSGSFDNDSTFQDVERAGQAERAALVEQAERICNAQESRNEAVLARLGISQQQDAQPPPKPKRSRCPQQGNQLVDQNDPLFWQKEKVCSPLAEVSSKWPKLGGDEKPLKLPSIVSSVEPSDNKVCSPTCWPASSSAGASLSTEDPLFWDKLKLGGKLANVTFKLTGEDGILPPSDDDKEIQTPIKRKARDSIRTPTLAPPPEPRGSRLPLMRGRQRVKDVAGCSLWTATEALERFIKVLFTEEDDHSPSPVRCPTRTPAEPAARPAKPSPRAPAEPSPRTPAGPSLRAPGGPSLRAPGGPSPRAPAGPSSRASPGPSSRASPGLSPRPPAGPAPQPPSVPKPRRGTTLHLAKAERQERKVEPRPLLDPSTDLDLALELLSSDDWEKKMKALEIVGALVQFHDDVLQTKLHDIVSAVSLEVKNLRSTLASAAINIIAELHFGMGRRMDALVGITSGALLLKLAATTSNFIHQEVTRALDAVVDGCSPTKVVTALLDTGLKHLNVSVRASTAAHLLQVLDMVGPAKILTSGWALLQRFLTAVSLLAVDAAPEPRTYGRAMLEVLAKEKSFQNLWDTYIPPKDKRPLEKFLVKLRRGL